MEANSIDANIALEPNKQKKEEHDKDYQELTKAIQGYISKYGSVICGVSAQNYGEGCWSISIIHNGRKFREFLHG